ncbi:MAG: DUF4236 domain-containing protein [Candidatus Electrothrix sp. AUS1_2]|nr:DUF4236 domain-containing protein [Candidatus Electrothrix sp. AUS1_2]
MAWHIRKSVKLGPVRFNFSKSGIGTSVGVKGFRIGVRANGKSYFQAGGHGLYYRQELTRRDNTPLKRLSPSSSDRKVYSSHPEAIRYDSASSQQLTSKARKEFVSALNQSYGGFRFDYLCAAISLIISLLLLNKNSTIGVVSIIFSIIITVAVAIWESKRRTITINYDFESKDGGKFKALIYAFNNLASNKKVWALIDSRNIHGSHESKLNAGASNLVNRSDALVGEGKPPWVKTNVDIPVLKARQQTLYMMPDGILVYDRKGVGFVEYDELSVDVDTTRFIEERPPGDAKIVDYTWQYPNKKGGPDKRFKNNRQIPVCLYGKLQIRSKSGLFFYLMTSQYGSPTKFKDEILTVLQ